MSGMMNSPVPFRGWVKPDEQEPEEPPYRNLLIRLAVVALAVGALVAVSWIV